MSIQLQLRRGVAAAIATFTGKQGEIVVATDTGRIVSQDGVTAGGFPHALLAEVAPVASVGNSKGVSSPGATSTIAVAMLGGFFEVTAAGTTQTIPTPVGNAAGVLEFLNTSSGNTTIATPAGIFAGPVGSTSAAQTLGAGAALYLISDGTNWLTFSLTAAAPGSRIFLSSGSGTIPAYANFVRMLGVGGGASGAGGISIASGGGSGGGSGGTGVKKDTGWIPVSQLAQLGYNVTIGAGGAAPAAGAVGNPGSNTTITFGSQVFTFEGATGTVATIGAAAAASAGGYGGALTGYGVAGPSGANAANLTSFINGVCASGTGGGSAGAVVGTVLSCAGGAGGGGAGGGLTAASAAKAGGNGSSAFGATGNNAGGAGGAATGAVGAPGVSTTAQWPTGPDGGGGGGGGGNVGAGGGGGAGGVPGGGGGGGGSGTTAGGGGGGGGSGAAFMEWI